jgi:GPH family glycoside/pentoside/hexuronide:cation symporter
MDNRLSVLEKSAYGAGDMALTISIISASILIYAFLIQVVGLTPVDAGWILMAVRTIDAISDPMMGWLTGNVRTRLGRYRHWLLIGALPFGISLYLLFTTFGQSYGEKMAWSTGVYIFNSLAFTVLAIPYISLIGVMTRDPQERLLANAYRFPMAKVATLIVSTFVPYWVTSGSDARSSYANAFLVIGLVSVLLVMFCAFNVKERIKPETPPEPLARQITGLVKNDQWLALSLAMVLLFIGLLVNGSIAIIYGKEFAGATDGWGIAFFMGMGSVGGIVGPFVSLWLTKRYCKVAVFRWSMYGSALVSALAWLLVGQNDFYLATAFYLLCSVVSQINTPILWSSITEASDYGRIKTGIDAGGLSIGMISFCQKFGMGLSGPITGYLMTWVGYRAGTALQPEAISGIEGIMTLVPAFFYIVVGLVMRKYIINNRYYNAMMAENSLPAAAIKERQWAG